MVNVRPPAHARYSYFLVFSYRNCHRAPSNSKFRNQKRDMGKEKNISAASKLFHVGESVKSKSSEVLHAQCRASPVTQTILAAFQLSSPALPWHASPGLLGKNCLERVYLRCSFKRANVINDRALLLAAGWRCMGVEAESCFECQK